MVMMLMLVLLRASRTCRAMKQLSSEGLRASTSASKGIKPIAAPKAVAAGRSRQLRASIVAQAAPSTDPLMVRAARGEDVERAPCWMMRQAGRCGAGRDGHGGECQAACKATRDASLRFMAARSQADQAGAKLQPSTAAALCNSLGHETCEGH